jgi:hypothetical protein
MDSKQTQARANAVPVIELEADCLGDMGLTVRARQADAGGGRDPGGVVIPLREVKWFDHRQTCERVLAYLHDDVEPDLRACPFWRDGRCAMDGGQSPCAFAQSADAEVWRKAAGWKLSPDGSCVVHRGLWAQFGLEG